MPDSDPGEGSAGGAGRSDIGVLLLAHGSERSGASAEPVLALARSLRSVGYGEVRVAFWKEEPFLHQAVGSTVCERVVAVPIFLAEGYFTRTVVPRETGLEYGVNDVSGRTVRLVRPVGTSPALDELIVERARAALPSGSEPADATLVVLGHGTLRSRGSGGTVFGTCVRLSKRGVFSAVVPAFIDQEPEVEKVVERLRSNGGGRRGSIVLVPFLVSAGWHGGTTVPAQLETGSGRGRELHYGAPVGTHPALVKVVRGMVEEAFAEGVPSTTSDGGDTVAEEVLPTTLLDVTVRRDGSGYEIRHVGDRAADAAELRRVGADEAERLSRRDHRDRHRPLRSAGTLVRGWRISASDAREVRRILRALYGSALDDRREWRRGTAGVEAFRETAARQTGSYAAAGKAGPEEVRRGVTRCCESRGCLRVRVWDESEVGKADADRVPCLRACPLLLSAVAAEVGGRAGESGGVDAVSESV